MTTLTQLNRPRQLARLVWYAALLVTTFGAVVGLDRLVGAPWLGHYAKVYVPLFVILCGILSIVGRKPDRLDALGISLVLAIPYGVLISLIQGGITDFRYFAPHLGGAIFGAVCYIAGRRNNLHNEWGERYLKTASYCLLTSYSAVIFIFWAYQFLTGKALFLGIGTGWVLLPFSYFLVKKRVILAAIAAITIVASGKRGVFLALLLVLLFWCPIGPKRNIYEKAIFVSICGLAVMIGILSLAALDIVSHDGILGRVLSKWQYINPYTDNFNLDLAFSKRNIELALVWAELKKNSYNLLVGLGYGWSYFFDVKVPGSTTNEFYRHYLHVSPANFIALYGVPYALIILYGMARIAAKAYRQARHDEVLWILVLFWIGLFGVSLSGYSYVSDPFFWLVLGAIGSFVGGRGSGGLNVDQIKS